MSTVGGVILTADHFLVYTSCAKLVIGWKYLQVCVKFNIGHQTL